MADPTAQEREQLITLYQKNNDQETERYIDALLKTYPRSSITHFVQGLLKDRQKDFNAAIQAYQNAINANPAYPEAINNLAGLYKKDGQLETAIEWYQKVLKQNSNFMMAHYNMGLCFHTLGQRDKALESYKAAQNLNPNFAEIYYCLHRLAIEENDLESAVAHMQKAFDLQPAQYRFAFFLGLCLAKAGKRKKAEPNFEMVRAKGNSQDQSMLESFDYFDRHPQGLPLLFGSERQLFERALSVAPDTGLILEFGVRHGVSIRQIASMTGDPIYGFDSFEGIPEDWNQEQAGSYSTQGIIPEVPDHVTLIHGWFEDSLPKFMTEHAAPIRLINIDCDIYSSTKTIFEHCAPHITSGTVLIFDEYICYPNWQDHEYKAFQEAASNHNWSYEYLGANFVTRQTLVKIL